MMRRLFGADSLRSDNRCSLDPAPHCVAGISFGSQLAQLTLNFQVYDLLCSRPSSIFQYTTVA
jgi:hypothetical protein